MDVGQEEELDGLEERAKACGASKLYIEDIVDDFCDNFIMPCVEAGAVYEHSYLLGTSMARPAIAKKLVEIARKENAVAICHGATGKGNDQIRFELGIKALAPDIKVIAPWRMTDKWQMDSREAEIEYCKAHGINLPWSMGKGYSRGTYLMRVLNSRIHPRHRTIPAFWYCRSRRRKHRTRKQRFPLHLRKASRSLSTARR